MCFIPLYIHKEWCMLGSQMLECPLDTPTSAATLCAVFFIHNPHWMCEPQENECHVFSSQCFTSAQHLVGA